MAKKIWDDWNDIPVIDVKSWLLEHCGEITFFVSVALIAILMGFLS
jgi:hypothetical protein